MVVLSYVGFITVGLCSVGYNLLEVRISGGKTSQKTLVKKEIFKNLTIVFSKRKMKLFKSLI